MLVALRVAFREHYLSVGVSLSVDREPGCLE